MIDKLKKMSEDALVNMLDAEFDKDPESNLVKAIDAELDKRAEEFNLKQATLEAEQQHIAENSQALIDEYETVVTKSGKRVVQFAMVCEWGDEFDDYYIDDNCTLYSVCERHANNASEWEHESVDDALKKMYELQYYRIYDKYFRHGPTQETLERLKIRVIRVIKEEQLAEEYEQEKEVS